MTKVAMPEPTVLRTVMPDDHRYGHVYGYTRKHMEAYATARVREALETAWISVEERLPDVGEWVNVLVDREEGDWFDRRDRPRYSVCGAQLRDIDQEGYASWQRWQMSDGGPMGKLRMVTHWQPLPEPPEHEQ